MACVLSTRSQESYLQRRDAGYDFRPAIGPDCANCCRTANVAYGKDEQAGE